MSYYKVRSLSFTKKGVRLSVASSNVVPTIYESALIEPDEENSMEDIIRGVFSDLEDRNYQILPSSKSAGHYAFLIAQLFDVYLYSRRDGIAIRTGLSNYPFKSMKYHMDKSNTDFNSIRDYADLIVEKDKEYIFDEDGNPSNIRWIFIGLNDVIRYSNGSMENAKKIIELNNVKFELFKKIIAPGALAGFNNKDYRVKRNGSFVELSMNNRFYYREKYISLKEVLTFNAKYSILHDDDYQIVDRDGDEITIKDILDLFNINSLIKESGIDMAFDERLNEDEITEILQIVDDHLSESQLDDALRVIKEKFN